MRLRGTRLGGLRMRLAAMTGLCAMALAIAGASPVSAQETDGSSRALVKAATYQTLSSLNDFAFGYFAGGGMLAGGLLVLANAASETVVAYLHDRSWSAVAGDTPEAEDATRSARTATYTGLNALRTFGMGQAVAGNPFVAAAFVAFNAATDAAVYAGNDKVFAAAWPAGTSAPDPARHIPSVSIGLAAVDPDEPDPLRDLLRDGPNPDRAAGGTAAR